MSLILKHKRNPDKKGQYFQARYIVHDTERFNRILGRYSSL
jgi:hypothetical protein